MHRKATISVEVGHRRWLHGMALSARYGSATEVVKVATEQAMQASRDDMTLAEAIAASENARRDVRVGKDPGAVVRAMGDTLTFTALWDARISDPQCSLAASSRKNQTSLLRAHVFPALGHVLAMVRA